MPMSVVLKSALAAVIALVQRNKEVVAQVQTSMVHAWMAHLLSWYSNGCDGETFPTYEHRMPEK